MAVAMNERIERMADFEKRADSVLVRSRTTSLILPVRMKIIDRKRQHGHRNRDVAIHLEENLTHMLHVILVNLAKSKKDVEEVCESSMGRTRPLRRTMLPNILRHSGLQNHAPRPHSTPVESGGPMGRFAGK
ncbi:hypothetical protein M408DRAFT_249768 [Serendipita vermifera MAFF 305830]|uniref:Uncharacterized protein n=1 Tax=Serendipita vermifera MAFF 305830 TaxID=933852 RepID=A0A0C3AUN8_SERVB|nr:hypothetical protein M408DRAFT_249768 [Serendipita vermifera MAFF 305830]